MSVNKFVLSFLSVLSLLLGLVVLIPDAAAAAEASVAIPVRQTFTQDVDNHSLTMRYQLIALQPGEPLPRGSDGNVYTFELKDDQSTTLQMTYVDNGRYSYQLQVVDPGAQAGYTFDERVYLLDIYVENGGAVVIAKDNQGLKLANIDFDHEYHSSLPPVPNTDGDPPSKPSIPQLPQLPGVPATGGNTGIFPKTGEAMSFFGSGLGVVLLLLFVVIGRRKRKE